MSIVFLLIAGLAGALMAVQGCLNSYLGEKLGLIPATFGIQLLGTLTVGGLLLFFFKGGSFLNAVGEIPYYYWLGGPIGVAIIYGVAVAISKIERVTPPLGLSFSSC